MRPTTRLDKAINGLQDLLQKSGRQNGIKISKTNIVIDTNGPQIWGTIFYLAICFLFPIGYQVHYLLTDKSNLNIFWLLLPEIIFGYISWKMVRGQNRMTIDFPTKQIHIENVNGVFKKWFKPRTISFSEIIEVHLTPEKYSKQLKVKDRKQKTIVLTEFDNREIVIAHSVKVLMDVIICHGKDNQIPVAQITNSTEC